MTNWFSDYLLHQGKVVILFTYFNCEIKKKIVMTWVVGDNKLNLTTHCKKQ